jgi:hypothetical protein
MNSVGWAAGQGAGFGPFRACLRRLPVLPGPVHHRNGNLRLAASGVFEAGPAVTVATSPHLGQAAAPASKEKQQPQKHATSVMTGTFFLCAPAARAAGIFSRPRNRPGVNARARKADSPFGFQLRGVGGRVHAVSPSITP